MTAPAPTLPATEVRSGEAPLRVIARRHTEWPAVAPIWSRLADRCARTSFFLTPAWVDAWISVFGPALNPEILLFESAGEVRAACLLVRTVERRGPFKVRRVYFNTAGEREEESACIEFNDLLCDEGCETAMARALAEHLAPQPWDELSLDGFSEGPGLDALRAAFSALAVEDSARPARYVDLERLRKTKADYLASLGSSRRYRLRRAVKRYAELGPIEVREARDVTEAHAFLDELARLHQRTWEGRGHAGAFGAERFVAFHRRLIERAFPTGGAQLLRLTAGAQLIGVSYNLVHRGKACFYQAGYDYQGEKLKPGYVSHVLAIDHARTHGLREYDLMGGAQPYKEELADEHRLLHWVTLGRRTPRMRLITALRLAARRVREEVARRRAGAAPQESEAGEGTEAG
jgi:CelD/BcsL family acetyltransferase involved in cellulose biosynthesis